MPSRGASVGDKASEGQQRKGCETYDAGSLLRSPLDGGPSALDSHNGRRKRGDEWDDGDSPQRPGRSRGGGHHEEEDAKREPDDGPLRWLQKLSPCSAAGAST